MMLLISVIVALLVAVAATSSKLLYREGEMGNYNSSSCSSAPSCGTSMASYNGVAAYSNGEDQCTGNSCSSYGTYGYKYQCVELAQRYFATKLGVSPAIWYSNANEMCSNHPSSVYKTSSPQPGDLVVFSTSSYGHVAIITSISGGTINVIEQNSSPTGTNSYDTSNVLCYLTTSGSSSGACSHTGYYCGNDGLNMDADTLYYCSGSGATPSTKSKCTYGCTTAPSGYDDYCATSTTCSHLGYYCGDDGLNMDADTLYYCSGSGATPSVKTKCTKGCTTAPSGSDDYCA